MNVEAAVFRTLRIEAGELLLELFDERVLDVFVKEEVIRGDAGLAAVEALAPCDAAGGDFQVRVFVDNARTLASELQHHRGKILCLSCGNLLCEGRTAGEEDHVPAAGEELGVHGAVALHHGDIVGREGVCNEIRQRLRNVGNVGRWFENRRAACGDGPHEGIEEQLYRIVPRGDDERAAKGLANHVTRRRHAGEGSCLAASARPVGQALSGVADLSVHQADFGHVGLFVTFVKVGPEGVAKRFLPFSETFLVATQHLAPEGQVACGVACKKTFLRLNERIYPFGGGVLKCHFLPVKWSITV